MKEKKAAKDEKEVIKSKGGNGSQTSPTTLNVIFHGLFGFVINPRHIEVVATRIPEHLYLAGTWMMETQLQPGVSYVLHGVSGQKYPPTIDQTKNARVGGWTIIDRSPDKHFCSFCLPFPNSVSSERLFEPNSDYPIFSGSDAPSPPPYFLAMVPIFTYTVNDLSKVELTPDIPWKPAPECKSPYFTNLHIWAEPLVPMKAQGSAGHFAKAFESLAAQFSGLDMHVANADGKLLDPCSSTDGVPSYELQTLLERYEKCMPENGCMQSMVSDPRNCGPMFIDNSTLNGG